MAEGITRIAVEGFKSIAKRQEIEIAPLTILAGANSSGKSSIMQPLLMLKQTLEATYDPGALKIDGPNVKFTRTEEFLSRNGQDEPRRLRVEIFAGDVFAFKFTFAGLDLIEQTYRVRDSSLTLRPTMSCEEVQEAAGGFVLTKPFALNELSVTRDRFVLNLRMSDPPYPGSPLLSPEPAIQGAIHVPGLRGNSSRTYRVAAVGRTFPGTFDNYVASVILAWQKEQSHRAHDLNMDLQGIGLARSVSAHRIDDVAIELRVGLVENRLDNIADVGFGVSQILPVLVALRTAEPGRLVYVEEPEIDLHPRAQTKLADILAGAAKRGVRVVAETHSSLLLRAIQTLVAKGDLDPELVRMHWFTRNADGVTQVSSTKLDANGAFGDWPEDFDDVALDSEQQYLDAVEDRITP
jgi:hypothetical protein